MNINWKIAFRSFRKNKFYSLINIAGLAVGLAGCILIFMYLQNELNYDQFLEDKDRIHQVVLSGSFGGDEFEISNTPPPVGEALQTEFPEIESYTRYHTPGDLVMHYEDQKFTESHVWMVDSNFLEFFSFPLIKGDATTCLRGTQSIVLTERMAQKYFGQVNPLGQQLFLQEEPFTVVAILRDLPAQSSLQFDALVPIATSDRVKFFSWSWIWLQVDTYVKTKRAFKKDQLSALAAKFPTMVRQQAASAFKRVGQDIDEFFEQGNRWDFYLNPLKDIHLNSAEVGGRLDTKGDIQDIYIFGTVGLFLLLLACINFMNLATAQSLSRTQEVGVRKVLGSSRSTLIGQFLSEAMLYSIIAQIGAIGLVILALPPFNQVMNQELQIVDLVSGWTFAAVLVLPIIVGFLAGSYPAFFLSKFKPVAILKGKSTTNDKRQIWLRNGLVVFQFTISLALVICTWTVLQQINYAMNGDLGINEDDVIVIPNVEYLNDRSVAFKEALQQLPEIEQASITTSLPSSTNFFGDFYVPEKLADGQNAIEDLQLFSYMVDADFVPSMGINILQGRNFDKNRGLDSLTVILNQTAVNMIGWEEPIGKFLTYPGGNNRRYEVIGVMKDFHILSLRQNIEPFALFNETADKYGLPHSFIAAKLKPKTNRKVFQQIEQLWTSFAPTAPFNFSFLTQNINGQYQSEDRLSRVLGVFTMLSIFVACLGLLGLITYATEQRVKEIGVRKVLGATTGNIIQLLSKDFLKLVLVAFVIAAPIAYYLMDQWLQEFAYRIDIQWWVFLLAASAAMVIAFLTVGFQSAKAALANPVDSLRNE